MKLGKLMDPLQNLIDHSFSVLESESRDYGQGLGHVTSVNSKIQNNVIYGASLLLLATPDVATSQ